MSERVNRSETSEAAFLFYPLFFPQISFLLPSFLFFVLTARQRDDVPREPPAAAALKQTSQRAEPSADTGLFAEQQWSFVAGLAADSKL